MRLGTASSNRALAASLFLCMLALLTGCGLTADQRAALKGFAEGASDFSTFAACELAHSRDDVIAFNTLRVALGDGSVDPKATLDHNFTIARVKERVDALNALHSYARLLASLADGGPDEVKVAAEAFVISLGKVNGAALSKDQANTLLDAVDASGSATGNRSSAAKQVMEAASLGMDRVITQIERDFDPNAEHWNIGYDVARIALDGQVQAIAAQLELPAWNSPRGADTSIRHQAASLTKMAEVRRRAVKDQLAACVAKLRDAEKNVRYVIQAPDVKTDDIRQYRSQVQDFVTVWRIVRPAE